MNKALETIVLSFCLCQLLLGQILLPLDRKVAVGPLPDDPLPIDHVPVDPLPDEPRPVESCNERLVCQSNNDPHMVNFWNQPFEYQYDVFDQCMHITNYVQVSASFNRCPSPWHNARCNCAVKITLFGRGQQTALLDNCGNSVFNTNMVTFYSIFSRPFPVTCQTVSNPLFNPLDESSWALLPVTSGNSFFLCAIFNQHTYIKTRLSPNDNVIVEIFPGMNSLYVHASKSYTASPTINTECLCEEKKKILLSQLHANLVDQMPREIEKCKTTLLNECFRNLLEVENLFTPKRIEEIEKLIANCALDLKEARGDKGGIVPRAVDDVEKPAPEVEIGPTENVRGIGAFQQTEIQNQIDTAILEAFAIPKNQDILTKYCACQSNYDLKQAEICQRLNIIL